MASSSSSSASVHAAIQALYGTDSARRREANDFLVAHAATPAAWETALHLLASADASVCYFGANLLHGKCKADFASLPPAHRGAFLDACSNALDGLAARGPECFLAARRLCLVLAAGSARCGPERATRWSNGRTRSPRAGWMMGGWKPTKTPQPTNTRHPPPRVNASRWPWSSRRASRRRWWTSPTRTRARAWC